MKLWRGAGQALGVLALVSLAGCGGSGPPDAQRPTTASGGTSSEPGVSPEDCVDDVDFFEQEVHTRVLAPVCMTCHIREGLARDSAFVLETAARPDQLEVNRVHLSEVAHLEQAGELLLLAKPLGQLSHGGGVALSEDSPEYALLEEFVARLEAPVPDCPGDDPPGFGSGLGLLPPSATLRKATLQLVGRLPTPEEMARVEAGGEPALREAVRAVQQEPAYLARMQELFNDLLLTDRYLEGELAVDLLDAERFPGAYWYDAWEDDRFQDRTNAALAREPLEIFAYLLREDRPYTEILTADYTLVNAYSALAYGVPGASVPDGDDPRSLEFYPAQVPGWPHAGVLSTPAYLNRYPSTPTNRNRHRTWAFMRKFLATDLLTFAERPIDPSISEVHNATLNDPQCTVCHAVMDPIAGTFQTFDDVGHYVLLEDGWYPEMAVPGFEGLPLPAAERPQALTWMAQQAAADGRFDLAAVRFVLHGLTGLPLLEGTAVLGDPDLEEAYRGQQALLQQVAERFREGGHRLSVVVEEVVMSHAFRAIEDKTATVGELELAGTAKLLTPEELDRKIRATTGVKWAEGDGTPYLADRYRLLYGGIDSDAVVERLVDPNGVMANIALRMTTEVACRAVPQDLVLPPTQRRLLPWVEPSYEPVTVDGFAVPAVEDAIRENLVHLHARLLGEQLGLHDAEIDHSYQLWLDTWQEGRALVEAGEWDDTLPWDCQPDDPEGVSLPDALDLEQDPNFTVRAWMAVVAYLLADSHFLYE